MKKFHLLGIGGTGMASLASLLKKRGYVVTGCDKPLYSPMKEFIENLNIEFFEGFSRSHLNLKPDYVVIGNALNKENEEAKAFIENGFTYFSMASAIYEFAIKGRKSIVVTGTHGKTTTTSLIAFLLNESGIKTNMLLGGISKNYKSPSLWEDGDFTVVEGDEYETAFFDKKPKFLHYFPYYLIINNIEMDHLDNFKNEEELKKAFLELTQNMEKQGAILIGSESLNAYEVGKNSQRYFETFGLSGSEVWSASEIRYCEEGTYFRLIYKGKSLGKFLSPLYGQHNLRNCIVSLAVAIKIGASIYNLQKVLPQYSGVKRRQEIIAQKEGITIIDDFGHHPTAIEETLKALISRFKKNKTVIFWEPRSYTSQTKFFEDKMIDVLSKGDLIFMGPPPSNPKIKDEDKIDLFKIAEELNKKGKKAFACLNEQDFIKKFVNNFKKEESLILFFSPSNFFDLPLKISNLL